MHGDVCALHLLCHWTHFAPCHTRHSICCFHSSTYEVSSTGLVKWTWMSDHLVFLMCISIVLIPGRHRSHAWQAVAAEFVACHGRVCTLEEYLHEEYEEYLHLRNDEYHLHCHQFRHATDTISDLLKVKRVCSKIFAR